MKPQNRTVIARVAVLPFTGVLLFATLTLGIVLFAYADGQMSVGQPRALVALVAVAIGAIWAVASPLKLLLVRGALIYATHGYLVETLALCRRVAITDIASISMADSKIFVGRKDQVRLQLTSGRIIVMKVIFMQDDPDLVLHRLQTIIADRQA